MNARLFLFTVTCLAAVTLSTSSGAAATHGGMGVAAPAMHPAPAITHTASATTTATFHNTRNRVIIVDEFGFPFFPFGGPFWWGYPYGYYPYGYSYYNTPVYGGTYYGDSVVPEVQWRLARAGYYHGAIDGVIGPRTRAGIRAYERDHGLRVDGAISRQLIDTMGLRG